MSTFTFSHSKTEKMITLSPNSSPGNLTFSHPPSCWTSLWDWTELSRAPGLRNWRSQWVLSCSLGKAGPGEHQEGEDSTKTDALYC